MTRSAPLSDLAVPKGLVGGPFGSSLVNSDYASAGVPVIRGTNLGFGRYLGGPYAFVSEEKVVKDLARNTATTGDVIFTQRGTLGQVAIVPANAYPLFVVSQSQMRLRVDPAKAAPAYVYYACASDAFMKQIDDNAISTGVPHINLGILNRLTIPLPPLQEQRAIAEVLGAFDDKIAVNTKLAATSDDLIALHFRHAVASEGTASRPLFDAIDIDFGEPFQGINFSEPGTGRPLIRIRDLKTFTSQVWTTESRSREILVQPGDVVVGMDAEFRPTSWLGEPGLLNQRVCRARGKSTGPAFVRETLKEPLGRIEGYKTATTVIHLNKKDLQEAEVLVPDSDSLALFEASVEVLYSQRVGLAIENRTLSAIRDALLPQLMSGQLRVKDAENVLETAGV